MNSVIKAIISGTLGVAFTQTVFGATTSNGDLTLYQVASIAPSSASNTPGWQGYLVNMTAGVTSSGFSNVGNPETSPSAYVQTDSPYVHYSNALITEGNNPGNFNSWKGELNPSGAFAAEYGTRVHFNLVAVFNTATTVTSISYEVNSVVSPGTVYANNLTTFAPNRMGVTSFGADNVLGGGDDTYVTSGGMSASPVLAVIYSGFGVASWVTRTPDTAVAWPAGTTAEAMLAAHWQYFNDSYHPTATTGWDLTPTYTINYGAAGTLSLAGDTVILVPEPQTLLSATAALGLLAIRRRRAVRG